MPTRAELKTAVANKIDITGRRLTTGQRVRDLMDTIIDAIFDQFPQRFKQTGITLVAGTPLVVTIPSATYPGTISNIDLWDANGSRAGSGIFIQRGVSGSDQTLTLTAGKTMTNLELNVLVTP